MNNKFDEIILTEIRKHLKITNEEILSLEFVNGIEYNEDTYDRLMPLLINKDLHSIKSLSSIGNGGLTDNLLIYILKQQGEPDRLITILDKFDIWSDPFVLDIF